jgi:predicted transcriptional regulator YdeE
MNNGKNIELDSFSIVGISVRTTNQDGQSQTDIGQLWQRFIEENLIAKIPEKNSTDTYCVYTDYESDFNGAYTTLIGCRVNSTNNIPEGFTKKDILKGKYLKIESKGKLPDCVVQSWMSIWQSPIDRAYLADFDVYGEGCKNPQNATVDIYLSIK